MDHLSRDSLFTIGEFSRITGLTVKALRFYHELGLLEPAFIDAENSYRYYTFEQMRAARLITTLRTLDLPVKDIQSILRELPDRQPLVDSLEKHAAVLQARINQHRRAVRLLRDYLAAERQSAFMTAHATDIQEKDLEPLLIAGMRMKGKYADCGKAFGKLCRGARGDVAGPPMMLHYDSEFKENDADFEPCIPLKKSHPIAGASLHQLPGGRCVSLLHRGPYEQLGSSYARILQYLKSKGYTAAAPSREIYLKGPGMIFRGNPNNYLTEIQMLIAPS